MPQSILKSSEHFRPYNHTTIQVESTATADDKLHPDHIPGSNTLGKGVIKVESGEGEGGSRGDKERYLSTRAGQGRSGGIGFSVAHIKRRED